MVWKGCERSVITYSSLISACEKAGQWELALELFNEMHSEGCVPNTVTFNSLITACAQGMRNNAHHGNDIDLRALYWSDQMVYSPGPCCTKG